MAFRFVIPAAKYKADAIRGVDGELIHTLKKIRKCPREVSLGRLNRRHLTTDIERVDGRDKYEHAYHATKGWRTRRA